MGSASFQLQELHVAQAGGHVHVGVLPVELQRLQLGLADLLLGLGDAGRVLAALSREFGLVALERAHAVLRSKALGRQRLDPLQLLADQLVLFVGGLDLALVALSLLPEL